MNIGIDISEIDELKNIIKNKKYMHFLFTQNELEIAKEYPINRQAEYFAGRFSSKEAVSKALETGFLTFKGVKWKDIEILKMDQGEPYVVLHNKANIIFKEKGYQDIKISISHKKNLVVSFALIL